MPTEKESSSGSIYGVVDSMRNMTSAMEQLLRFLPENFVWPTLTTVSPFSVLWEWGHRDKYLDKWSNKGTVWLVAGPGGCQDERRFSPGLARLWGIRIRRRDRGRVAPRVNTELGVGR